jgi:hypothetical protein
MGRGGGGEGQNQNKIYSQKKIRKKNLPRHSAKKIPSWEDKPINFT